MLTDRERNIRFILEAVKKDGGFVKHCQQEILEILAELKDELVEEIAIVMVKADSYRAILRGKL